MGRPRVHDADTAAGLLDAAEQMLQQEGLAALSMRALAARAGVTTRAIYSVFASKDEVLARLAARGFDVLGRLVSQLPVTDDPEADLIAAGLAFRGFATRHRALFGLVFGLGRPSSEPWPGVRSAQGAALDELRSRVARVAGQVDDAELQTQVRAFHALCEGLAALENRHALEGEHAWRAALAVCVRGIAAGRMGA